MGPWMVRRAAAREELERRLEARRLEEADPEARKAIRRGWCLGGEQFKGQMVERLEGNLGEHHSGELRRESAADKAERIVAEELGRLGWEATELAVRRKNDPGKLAIAARLRRETTLSMKAIAFRTQLGTSRSANARLHKWMRQDALTDCAEATGESK